jgi:hypothetical protein
MVAGRVTNQAVADAMQDAVSTGARQERHRSSVCDHRELRVTLNEPRL